MSTEKSRGRITKARKDEMTKRNSFFGLSSFRAFVILFFGHFLCALRDLRGWKNLAVQRFEGMGHGLHGFPRKKPCQPDLLALPAHIRVLREISGLLHLAVVLQKISARLRFSPPGSRIGAVSHLAFSSRFTPQQAAFRLKTCSITSALNGLHRPFGLGGQVPLTETSLPPFPSGPSVER